MLYILAKFFSIHLVSVIALKKTLSFALLYLKQRMTMSISNENVLKKKKKKKSNKKDITMES